MPKDEPATNSSPEQIAKPHAFHLAQEPVTGLETEGDAHKYDIAAEPAPPAPAPAYEELGELPASYLCASPSVSTPVTGSWARWKA